MPGAVSFDPRKRWLALCLTWTAGFVDLVGYLTLYHIYTANMSGNSVAFGMSGVSFNWHRVFERGMPILFFVIGLCLCGILLEWSRRRGQRGRLARILGIEAACLVAFVLVASCCLNPQAAGSAGHRGLFVLLVALAAGAMGIQNASLTHVGPLSIHTTHVTGTLLNFAQNTVWYGFWVRDRLRGRGKERLRRVLACSLRQAHCRRALLLGGMWVAYVAGAVVATILLHSIGLASLLAPVAILLLFIALDMRRPFTTDPPGI